MGEKQILIVDDHPIVRYGFRQLIEREDGLAVCGDAGSAEEVFAALDNVSPDMFIVDISLGGRSGLELVKALRDRGCDQPILVLSIHDEGLYAERALRAGASGYAMKQSSPDDVVAAIRRVLDGEVSVSEEISSRLLRHIVTGETTRGRTGIERLSDREIEIFEWIGRGRSTHAIARKIGISVKTVETHRTHIRRKLDLASSAEVLNHAIRWVEGTPAAPDASGNA